MSGLSKNTTVKLLKRVWRLYKVASISNSKLESRTKSVLRFKMKVLLIFGFATFALAEKNDTSLLPTRKHKTRLKNETIHEREHEEFNQLK